MRMQRWVILFLLGVWMGCAACSDSEPKRTRYASAGECAVAYYTHLFQGEYDKYVDGMHSCDSLPPACREQMALVMKQFVLTEKGKNGGVRSVELSNELLSDDGASAQVFLLLVYDNGNKEEIVVPMVNIGKEWRLK